MTSGPTGISIQTFIIDSKLCIRMIRAFVDVY